MELSKLTRRELEVALLAAEGLSNKEIASELNISQGTTKIHLHTIYGKLGIKNRLVLIVQARDNSKDSWIRHAVLGMARGRTSLA